MSAARVLLGARGFIEFVDSMVHVYNCFRQCNVALYRLLFVYNKSLYDGRT